MFLKFGVQGSSWESVLEALHENTEKWQYSCRVSDEQADQTDSAFTAADKNARALRKKLKQVDALLDKQKSSVELTGPELEKIKKAVQW